MTDELLAGLEAGARSLGLDLQPEQSSRLLKYLALLSQWGRVYNLTAIRDPREGLTQHLLDCLAVVPPLRRQCPAGGRLLDVGSGAGLPGLVIATLCPEWHVTCVDTVAKKMAFVQQAAGQMGLTGFSTLRVCRPARSGGLVRASACAFGGLDGDERPRSAGRACRPAPPCRRVPRGTLACSWSRGGALPGLDAAAADDMSFRSSGR